MSDVPVVKKPAALPTVEGEPSPEDKLGQRFAEAISRAEADMSDAIGEFVKEKFGGTDD